MSGVDRDIQCGQSFAKLYELGCFDEEFIVYGCGYYQGGEITYLVSDNGDKLYRFRNEALQSHIYTTPVIMKLASCQVASGERENIHQNIKFKLAKELQSMYSRTYYETIKQLDSVANNQEAETFLEEERRRLEGYFDRSGVEMFQGLYQMAYECKRISEGAYQAFAAWVKYAKKQMENDILVKDKLQRVFHGFGYEINGVIKYFADAQAMNVYKKKEELLLKGAVVTPIISKEYWFPSVNQLASIRTQFMAYLKACVDNGYMEKTKIIISYESPFDKCVLETLPFNVLSDTEKGAIELYKKMMAV